MHTHTKYIYMYTLVWRIPTHGTYYVYIIDSCSEIISYMQVVKLMIL